MTVIVVEIDCKVNVHIRGRGMLIFMHSRKVNDLELQGDAATTHCQHTLKGV